MSQQYNIIVVGLNVPIPFTKVRRQKLYVVCRFRNKTIIINLVWGTIICMFIITDPREVFWYIYFYLVSLLFLNISYAL